MSQQHFRMNTEKSYQTTRNLYYTNKVKILYTNAILHYILDCLKHANRVEVRNVRLLQSGMSFINRDQQSTCFQLQLHLPVPRGGPCDKRGVVIQVNDNVSGHIYHNTICFIKRSLLTFGRHKAPSTQDRREKIYTWLHCS